MKTAVPSLTLLVCTAVLLLLLGRHTRQTEAGEEYTVYLPIIAKPEAPTYPRGNNLLNNSSFEGGWYHPNGIPELQIPNEWVFVWEEGPTGFGSETWDVWVRPEVRVFPSYLLPPHEHPLFIWDGVQTVKIFKDSGAISFELTQNVWLESGTYVLEMSVFPDLVVYYENGEKVWAPDPLSGEVKLIAGNNNTGWLLPTFGDKNTYYFVFTVAQAQNVRVGAAMRGRWAIRNNGWFMDDWWLSRLPNTQFETGVFDGRGQPPRFSDEYIPPAEPYIFPVVPVSSNQFPVISGLLSEVATLQKSERHFTTGQFVFSPPSPGD